MRHLFPIIVIFFVSCNKDTLLSEQGVWRLYKVDGDYYSFLDGILYEYEQGREYRLYLLDGIFYFPTMEPSAGKCLPFFDEYEMSSDTLTLTREKNSFSLIQEDSFLHLSADDYTLTFLFLQQYDSIKSDYEEIYFEMYLYGILEDTMTIKNVKSWDIYDCFHDFSFESYLFWVVNSIDDNDFNRIYGLNFFDDFEFKICFTTKRGEYYEIITYGKSYDTPYEILLLRDCLVRVNDCL